MGQSSRRLEVVDLRISRIHNRDDRPYRITITDAASGVMMLEISLSGEDLALCLTGGTVDGLMATVGGLEIFGRTRTSVIRHVADVDAQPSDSLGLRRAERLAEAAALLERERPGYGWWARRSDLGNTHHRVKGERCVYEVVFFGYEPRQEQR